MKNQKVVKGWKCFENDMTCHGFQFEIGKSYHQSGKIQLCENGFHFHTLELDIFKYYPYDKKQTIVCKIEAMGNIIHGDDKSVCSDIKIIKKLSWNKVKKLVLRNGNTGLHNSGYHNSGNYNSGHRNSGNYNSGYRNSGNYNSGHRNSGHRNSGNFNSGDYNSGFFNSGDYNSGHRNSGFFNSDEPTVRMFNKDTGLKRNEINIPIWLYNLSVTKWIHWEDMLEDEQKEKNCHCTGGYTKTIPYKEAWKNLWVSITEEQKKEIEKLPNFDPKIFEEITGIKYKRNEKLENI